MKLYIYNSKNKDSWMIYKNKTDDANLTYWSFVHVAEKKTDDLKEYLVYYSTDMSRCMIKEDKLEISDFKYQYSFYASVKRNGYNSILNINLKSDPKRIKISTESPIDGWSKYLTIYTLRDIDVDNRIKIIENSSFIQKPELSIAMGYYNRKEQLLFTLKTLEYSSIKNFELIIADDASSDDNKLEDILENYPFKIKLIRISQEYKDEKNYKNPCVVYNFAFELVKADKVIIQNPECCHIGDILSYTKINSKNNYLVFSCMNLPKPELNIILQSNYISYKTSIYELLKVYNGKLPGANTSHAFWYSHQKHRSAGYHFTTAISKKNLEKIDGFDNMFAYGFWYDDDQFIYNIRKCGIKVTIVPEIVNNNHLMSIHQWHPKFTNNNPNFEKLKQINKRLINIYKR